MIQRIQSLYLLIAAVLMGLMCFLPIADFYGVVNDSTQDFVLTAFGLSSVASGGEAGIVVVDTLAMGIVIAAAALLPFITIFLFKRRMLQFRLCASEIVLLIGAQIFAVFYAFRSVKGLEDLGASDYMLKLPFFFPVLASIFVLLAIRGVMKDMRLIKSLDRIR